MRYQAGAYHMDTEDLAADLGLWDQQETACLACQEHAHEQLAFRTRQPGIWKAQGSELWYKVEEQPGENQGA